MFQSTSVVQCNRYLRPLHCALCSVCSVLDATRCSPRSTLTFWHNYTHLVSLKHLLPLPSMHYCSGFTSSLNHIVWGLWDIEALTLWNLWDSDSSSPHHRTLLPNNEQATYTYLLYSRFSLGCTKPSRARLFFSLRQLPNTAHSSG